MGDKAPIILTLTLALATLSACSEEKSEAEGPVARPVKAIKISDASILQKRWFPGRAKAANEVELSFRVGGTLLDLPVKVGDQVKKGDLIAKLDPATYQADVDRISANLQRAQAALKNASLQLERQITLFEKGHVAKAAVDKYEARESETRADVASQEAALKRAQLDLGYTTLNAPFAGTIVATYVDNFEDVNAKQRVARLLDPSQIEMVVNIPENLISLAPRVKEVGVIFDAFPEVSITAKIKEIGTEASETTRTYPITLSMNQPEGVQILPGMAGKATGKSAVGSEDNKIVVVPPAALFSTDDDKTAVWIIDEGTMSVSRQEVSAGKLTGTGIRVESGLKSGQWVVTAGVNSLREGQKVRILEQN